MDCHQCGEEVPRPRPNQKWCRRCARLKSIVALHDYPADCHACGAKFHRLERRQRRCYACHFGAFPGEPLQEPCRFCARTDGPAAAPGVALCAECASSGDPDLAARVVRAAAARLRA